MITVDEMLKYLKALDENEEIFYRGDHPYCSGTLRSVSNDGWRHYGNLGDEYVDRITFTDEEYETIKEEVESNAISYDERTNELIEVMAYKKGCLPNKEYFCGFRHWYRDSNFDEVMEYINFYDTFEEAFQDLGADTEVIENYGLYEWCNSAESEIKECYDVVVNFKNVVSKNR